MFKTTQAGRKAIGMDLEIGGAKMDMTTDIGFANSLYQAANLKPGAAALAAPVCGSWVFMQLGVFIFYICTFTIYKEFRFIYIYIYLYT